jgi:hypothetical protein
MTRDHHLETVIADFLFSSRIMEQFGQPLQLRVIYSQSHVLWVPCQARTNFSSSEWALYFFFFYFVVMCVFSEFLVYFYFLAGVELYSSYTKTGTQKYG